MIQMSEEKEWQDKWKESGIFNSEPDHRKKYLITVPWPYTSGPLHVGHGRTYTLADIMGRYKRLMGYNVLFPMGFHESGTPIGSISEKIKRGEEKTISLYRKYISEYENNESINEIIESFKDPLNVANYFASKITKDFMALGYSIDWRRSFRSIDPAYSKFVQWQFRKLGHLNLLKQGSHPVLYSPEDGNAVGEDDIEDGDTNKVSIEKFSMVLFKNTTDDYYLAAASLRPETLFAVTNLWINPDSKYMKIRINDKIIVVSEYASKKVLLQFEDSEVIGEVTTVELLKGSYTVPFAENIVNVYSNHGINPEQATGVVYSVPGHSVMDLNFIHSLDLDIQAIHIITAKSGLSKASDYLKKFDDPAVANTEIYRDEFYDGSMVNTLPFIGGKSVKDARDVMNSKLFEKGIGFLFYEPSRPAKTRDGKPVIVSIMHDQWFIDYSDEVWKKHTVENVSRMEFFPEFYRKNMFDVIDWIEERACARKRGLGTSLPQDPSWVIESLSDSTIYPAFYTFSHLIDGNVTKEIDDEFFDYITNDKEERIPEKLGDLSEKAKEEFQYWYGVDQRITSASHMSNHLVFYLMNHRAILGDGYQPGGISIIGMVISNGAKISKSKGNAVSLLDVVKQYGADLFRLYVALVAEVDSVLDWNEAEIENIRGVYETIRNTLNMQGNNSKKDKYTEIFKIKFKHHLRNYYEKMDKFQIRGAYVEMIYEVLREMNQLGSLGMDIGTAVHEVRKEWVQVLSCVVPHMAESIWSQFEGSGFVSNSEMSIEAISDNEMKSERNFDYTTSLADDIRSIQSVTKIKPSEIKIIVCNEKIKEETMKIINGDLNVSMKSIIGNVKKYRGKLNMDVDEMTAILEFKSILEKIFSTDVIIEEYNGDGKGKVPLPGRPIIELTGDRVG